MVQLAHTLPVHRHAAPPLWRPYLGSALVAVLVVVALVAVVVVAIASSGAVLVPDDGRLPSPAPAGY